jgi:hypothetical protein
MTKELSIAARQRTISCFLFHQGIFSQNQHDCPFPPNLLKDRHFDTTEVIEAESQVVLNTLTGHYFQNPFKNGSCAAIGTYVRKGTTSRVMVAQN